MPVVPGLALLQRRNKKDRGGKDRERNNVIDNEEDVQERPPFAASRFPPAAAALCVLFCHAEVSSPGSSSVRKYASLFSLGSLPRELAEEIAARVLELGEEEDLGFGGIPRVVNFSRPADLHCSGELSPAHRGAVTALVVLYTPSPEAGPRSPPPRVASASFDYTICVWDLILDDQSVEGEAEKNSVSQLVATLKGHTRYVRALTCFFDDVIGEDRDDNGEGEGAGVRHRGRRRPFLASAADDSTIRLWDLALFECISVLPDLPDFAWCLAAVTIRFDPCVVSGCNDNRIRLWNVRNKRSPATLRGHSNAVVSLTTFSHPTDGAACLASGSNDKSIKLWNPATQENFATLAGHSRYVGALVAFVWAPTGRVCLASGSWDQLIKVWDLETFEVVVTLRGHTGPVKSLVAFATGPDDSPCLISGSGDNSIRVWDLAAARPRAQHISLLRAHTASVASLVLVRLGGKPCLVSGSSDSDCSVRLWRERVE
jgi:WD40 repeat protein